MPVRSKWLLSAPPELSSESYLLVDFSYVFEVTGKHAVNLCDSLDEFGLIGDA